LCAGTDPEDKRNRNHGANNTARVEELTDGLAAIVLAACPEMVPILTQHDVLHSDVD
jgi:glycerol-3-phosphate acyltransferase PlsY